MFISSKALQYRSFLSRSPPTNKFAVGIVLASALMVTVGAVLDPIQALDSVDTKEIRSLSARPIGASFAGMRYDESDPTWSQDLSGNRVPADDLPRDSADVEANMVSGHIQAF
jgi:hypothetical protein